MNAQTSQSTGTAASTQRTHMYVLTIDVPGRSAVTVDGTVTPAPGATRNDVYRDIKARTIRTYPEMARGIVVFFSLEPNTL